MSDNIFFKIVTIGLFICAFNVKVRGAIIQASAPKWVIQTNYTLNEKLLSNVSDGFGYLLVDYQQNIEAKTLYARIVTKILNTQGIQNASQISIDYNPAYEKIVFHEITINRNKKSINCYDINKIKSVHREKDLERHLYDASETVFLLLEGVEKGDIIDYSYSKVGINPLFKNNYADIFHFEFGIPITCLNISISCNNNRKLNFKYFSKIIDPVISKVGDMITYHWIFRNIPAKAFDGDLPKWYNNYNAVEISDFQSWNEVREWEENVFKEALNEPFVNKEIIAKINLKAKNQYDKVLQALHFVQDDIRYFGFENGVNSLQPHDPNNVFEQRFGDCKDKSVLLCSILKSLGIEAYPLLINTLNGYDLPNRLPNPYQFNHVIVAYKIDETLSFVDPTLSLQGGELIEIYLPNYYNGLLLDGKSENLLAIRFRNFGTITAEYHFFVEDYVKPAVFKIKTIYIGSNADQIRYEMNVKTYEEIGKGYIDFYSRFYPGIAIKDSIKFKEIGNNRIEVTEGYTVNNLFKKSESDSNTISAEFCPFLINNALLIPTSKRRTTPIFLNYPVNINENFYVHFQKESWDINIEDNNIKTNYLEYSSHYTSNKNTRTVNAFYSLNTLQDSVEAIHVADAIKYIEKINRSELMLSKNLLMEVGGKQNISYSKIFLFVLMVVIIGMFASKVYVQYNPLSKLNDLNSYQNIGGFLILLVIGTIIRPFYLLFQLFSSGYFSTRMDDILRVSKSAVTNLIIHSELFFNALILVSCCLSAILLFKKRTSFPIIASFILLITVIGGLVDSWAVNQYINSSTEIFDVEFCRNAVAAVIWIPYLFISKRCKNTFINYHPSKLPKTEKLQDEGGA